MPHKISEANAQAPAPLVNLYPALGEVGEVAFQITSNILFLMPREEEHRKYVAFSVTNIGDIGDDDEESLRRCLAINNLVRLMLLDHNVTGFIIDGDGWTSEDNPFNGNHYARYVGFVEINSERYSFVQSSSTSIRSGSI